MTLTSKDPVCGMTVEKPYQHKYIYKGHEYGFCSHECKTSFESNPEKFLVGQNQKTKP